MYACEFKFNLELDGRSWSKVQLFSKSDGNTCRHMDQRAHQSKKSNVLEAQARVKAIGTQQEASWPKTVARGRADQSADHPGRPVGGSHHRPSALASSFQAASLSQFGVPPLLQTPTEDPFAPPYKYERGLEQDTHISHPRLSLFTCSLGALPRSLGSLGGQEKQGESEEKLGEVPGLSALFSTCTSTDAYQFVHVHDYFSFMITFQVQLVVLCCLLD